MRLINGDCLERLKELEDNSVDAIVTDPPAGIGFMNKEWDSHKGGRDNWMKWLEEVMTEAKRVLKSGGHALVWAIPRTSHWTAMACENAGFEIRDCVYHIQSQGFPKSLNISKAIDKKFGVERVVIGKKTGGAHSAVSGNDGFGQGKYSNAERENSNCDKIKTDNMSTITAPATDLAKTYDGYGSQLKPAVECWWLIRKPLEGSIVDNVLKHGTGAINIDKSRIPTEDKVQINKVNESISKTTRGCFINDKKEKWDGNYEINTTGRFPSNLIHDGSDAVMEEFAKYGESKSSVFNYDGTKFNTMHEKDGRKTINKYSDGTGGYDDTGSVARFFYNTKSESLDNNIHYCYLCSKSIDKELCQKSELNAQNVEKYFTTIQAIIESIVAKNVNQNLSKKLVHYVKNVGNLCDTCAMNFVAEVVQLSKKEELQVTLDFITDSKKCILFQNLVYYVEMMDNIDTTQITQNLLKLFGYVNHVTTNYINEITKSESAKFIYQSKASVSERNLGLDGFEEKDSGSYIDNRVTGSKLGKDYKVITKNNHPTVKPVKLMSYLVNLIAPPITKEYTPVILDMFMGTGSTGIAALLNGYDFIGIEMQEDYMKIANARINNYEDFRKYLK